jgi:very-short-patch-repair endonuclease
MTRSALRAVGNPPYYPVDSRRVANPPFTEGELRHAELQRNCKGDFRQIISKLSTFKKMYWLPYNKDLKEFSRRLRKKSTLGEILLWQKLRAGSMMNYTFNRQKPLDRYIVDFYCKPLRLVIEIDGSYHFEEVQKVKDSERQKLLEKMGLCFLRFSEQQVRKDMDIVLKEIGNCIVEFEQTHSISRQNLSVGPKYAQ